MKDIEDHVVATVATQWRQLGNQLNVNQNSLDVLQHDYPNNCKECCSRMLADWLDQNTHENTTWEILIDAIHRLPTGMFYQATIIITQLARHRQQKCNLTYLMPYVAS